MKKQIWKKALAIGAAMAMMIPSAVFATGEDGSGGATGDSEWAPGEVLMKIPSDGDMKLLLNPLETGDTGSQIWSKDIVLNNKSAIDVKTSVRFELVDVAADIKVVHTKKEVNDATDEYYDEKDENKQVYLEVVSATAFTQNDTTTKEGLKDGTPVTYGNPGIVVAKPFGDGDHTRDAELYYYFGKAKFEGDPSAFVSVDPQGQAVFRIKGHLNPEAEYADNCIKIKATFKSDGLKEGIYNDNKAALAGTKQLKSSQSAKVAQAPNLGAATISLGTNNPVVMNYSLGAGDLKAAAIDQTKVTVGKWATYNDYNLMAWADKPVFGAGTVTFPAATLKGLGVGKHNISVYMDGTKVTAELEIKD